MPHALGSRAARTDAVTIDPLLYELCAGRTGGMGALLDDRSLEHGSPIRTSQALGSFSLWAVVDPQAACSFALERALARKSRGYELIEVGLRTWAASDPTAAWRWLSGEFKTEKDNGASSSIKQKAFNAVLQGWARYDMREAVTLVATACAGGGDREMRDWISRHTAQSWRVNSLVGQFMQQANTGPHQLAELSDWVAQLPESEVKEALERQLSYRLQQEQEANAEALWNGEVVRNGARARAVVNSLRQDPEAAATFVSEFVDLPDKGELVTTVISAWAGRDPHAAGDWLRSLEPGTQLDDAYTRYAVTIAHTNPETALAWSDAVTDDAKRLRVTRSILVRWLQRDPDKALEWLEQVPEHEWGYLLERQPRKL